MAKNQEARKRKHSSRNGSSGRGNGADVARLNGKIKHKTIEETPAWQKTLGALVIIAAVLAAAFLTGVIRIDRNIVDKSEAEDTIQEAQPTVAEIKDSKSNKTTSKYTQKEHSVNEESQETVKESKSKDKQDKDEAKKSAKDTKVEDKAAKVESKTKDKKEEVPVQKTKGSNEDIPAKANATKNKRDNINIPEETGHGETKVKEKDEQREDKAKARTQERSSKEKKNDNKVENTPEDKQKDGTCISMKGREERAEPAHAERAGDTEDNPKESRVTETDSPKGKMVTPKRTPKNEQKSRDPKSKQPPVKDDDKSAEDSSNQKQARGDGTIEVSSKSDERARRKEDETAPDRSESKSGAKQDASGSKKDGKTEGAPKRKTGKDEAVGPPPAQEIRQPEEKRTVIDDKSKDSKKTEDSSQKNRVKKSTDPGQDEKAKSMKSKESEKKEAKIDTEKKKEKEHQESKKSQSVPVKNAGSSSEETKTEAKDSTPPKQSPPSSSSSKKSSKSIPDEQKSHKAKEPSEQKDKKVVSAQSDTPPQDQSSGKPKDKTKTKPVKESPPKSPPSKDGPSKKEAQDPKVTIPQPPSIDKTKDSPKTKTKSKVDPELPPSSSPSSQSRDSPKDHVTKATVDASSGGGGRDKAAADHVGDASKTKEPVTRKTESKKPVDKKPAEKKPVIDKLLEEADSLVQNRKKDQALYKYEDIIKQFPNSAKALMAKAKLLDRLAEERRSNELLENAIKAYRQAADIPSCPRDIHQAALSRMADRLSFFGKSMKSIRVYQELVQEYPDDYEAKKNLAVQYLIIGKNEKAKPYFEQMIEVNPMDGFALVHLGFILKSEGNYHEAIPLLRAGIDTGDRGTNEGKFFFQLGDSLLRTGQLEESYKVYDEGVSRGHFRSRYQRSLYNVDSLRGRPFWTLKDAGYTEAAKKLESNWETIRDEALALLSTDGYFRNEEEKLRETGDWKQFTLFAQGNKDQANCRQTPRTCAIFDTIPESKGCKRGQVKFSVMHPGTHVWPHCGPTNCRLRSHLGLVIPQPVRLRVGNITRTWEEGKVFIFDDSFEHEVWQEADSLRLILIADLWHPDLSESEKRRLSPI